MDVLGVCISAFMESAVRRELTEVRNILEEG
jgi:hypothetical protein